MVKMSNPNVPDDPSKSMSVTSNGVLRHLHGKGLIPTGIYLHLSNTTNEKMKTKFIFHTCKTMADLLCKILENEETE